MAENPWSSPDISAAVDVGSIDRILALAQLTGHITTEERSESYRPPSDGVCGSANLPSAIMLQDMGEITDLHAKLSKTKHDIESTQRCLQTFDVMDATSINEQMRMLKVLSQHFSAIQHMRDEIVNRLQNARSYTGESALPVDPTYHKDVADLFPLISDSLQSLNEYLQHIKEAKSLPLTNSSMALAGQEISTTLRGYTELNNSLLELRQLIDRFEDAS